MAKRGKRQTAQNLFDQPLQIGDYVLLGGSYASMPGDWYLGKLVWVGKEELCIERWTLNGQVYHQQGTIYDVRAAGSMNDLSLIKEQARLAVKELTVTVQEAESALGRARDAVHNKLEDLAKGGLKIAPYDREASDACDAEARAIAERGDEELTASTSSPHQQAA